MEMEYTDLDDTAHASPSSRLLREPVYPSTVYQYIWYVSTALENIRPQSNSPFTPLYAATDMRTTLLPPPSLRAGPLLAVLDTPLRYIHLPPIAIS